MFQTTIALVLFLFPLAYSPGPGNLFFAANGARFGFRATLPANLGYHFATFVVTAAIGWGAQASLAKAPGASDVLQVAGALYVLWMAFKMIRAGALTSEDTARPASFVDGVVLLLLNPKAYLIISLMFTQFLSGAQGAGTVVWITLVFTLNNLVAFVLWTVLGDGLAKAFRTPALAHRLNLVFGGVLAAVAIWMLVT